MIGITLDDSDTGFLEDLLLWYSRSTFGPNSEIAFRLYNKIRGKEMRQE